MKRELQAYLLAGGNGSRAGGPKAWRDLEGRSLMERQVTFLTSRFRPESVAVSIQEGWRDRCVQIELEGIPVEAAFVIVRRIEHEL